jgi:nucleotide-binding universal stress UspA family protein
MDIQVESPPKKIILVPTDFSDVCGNAVSQAARLAQMFDYKLVVLHIVDNTKKGSRNNKSATTGDIEARLLEYKAAHEKKSCISVETLLKEGNIFTSINKAAENPDVRLMVMGTHGKKGLQYFTGSDILKVTDKSPVPVIIIQKRTPPSVCRNILIPVTHELYPDKKIAWAKYFSGIFNANIHLFQYFYKNKIQNDRLSRSMEMITGSFKKERIPFIVSGSEKESGFSDRIASYAVDNKCDLLMIIDVNHNVSSAAWFENLLFNREQIPVMTINLAKIKKPIW